MNTHSTYRITVEIEGKEEEEKEKKKKNNKDNKDNNNNKEHILKLWTTEKTGEEQNLHLVVQFHSIVHVGVFCLPAELDVAERV